MQLRSQFCIMEVRNCKSPSQGPQAPQSQGSRNSPPCRQMQERDFGNLDPFIFKHLHMLEDSMSCSAVSYAFG